jgi:hypothetical protein
MNFVKYSYPIKIVPPVPIENVPEVEQKKQPSNTKLPQDVAVTVTQANHEVKSESAGTESFTLTQH